MKIGSFSHNGSDMRVGIVLDGNRGSRVLDVSAAAARLAPLAGLPATLDAMIAAGPAILPRLRNLVEASCDKGEGAWFHPLPDVRWHIPGKPGKVLCAGRNFAMHLKEASDAANDRGAKIVQSEFPVGFVKVGTSLVGDGASVRIPFDVKKLDYEIEAAAVIGVAAERVSERDALNIVFGYTVHNDLSARDWQWPEMAHGMLMIGKNFPGAGPSGPWILTADELPDPSALHLKLRVNGQQRQSALCSEMIFSFPELIAFWSRMALEPGDLVCSGTPSGCASGHQGPDDWYLQSGDRVDAEVEQIGTVRTLIV